MAETNLAFSKVVATPTTSAWSQAYSAGKLFAALSLEASSTDTPEDLAAIGKDIISTLESEFFTLESKDLESIKIAVEATIARVGSEVKPSFIVCYLSDNVLYLFAIGGGKAILKRGEKIGTVLEGEENGRTIKSASGYVQDLDVIVLQTSKFQKIISPSTLASSMDKATPDEIAEELAPHIHERAEGGAAAVILVYKLGAFEDVPVASTVSTAEEPDSEENSIGDIVNEEKSEETTVDLPSENTSISESEINENIINEPTISDPKNEEQIPNLGTPTPTAYTPLHQSMSNQNPENIRPFENQPPPHLLNQEPKPDHEPIPASPFLTDMPRSRRKLSMSFKKPNLSALNKLPRSKKIIAIIAALLALILIIAVIFGVMTQGNKANEEKFTQVFNEANDKYNEGISLKDLNAPLAQESFISARNLLNTNKDAFNDGSDEDNQIEDLLSKVNAELGGETGDGETSTSQAAEADKSDSKFLAAEIDNSGSYFTQNDSFIYFIDSKGVSRVDKGNDKTESIIDKDWKTAGGIGTFGSNIYVLDKTDNVLKFVPSGNEYSSSDYFPSDPPSFTDSVDMAIDGSIYVLFKNGTIKKYTKAKEDAFEISGVDKSISNPTKIYTTENTDNLYILDNGNSRVVVLDKDGKFLNSYSADVIKKAKDIEANETAKKLYILSGSKIYEIDLK